MAEEVRSRLGRGLAALISDVGDESTGLDRARGQRRAAVDLLSPNPRNPRRRFAEDDLEELVASVRERGVVQPILVRNAPQGGGRFEIIAGERRWRAAQRAGVHDVPVVVLDVGDKEALEIAIVENVQRADLNAVEEAAGYEQLMGEFQYPQAELARIIGKSRSHIANTLRLLKLPETVQEHVRSGRLSAGHARTLIGSENATALADRIIADNLSVREAEALARRAVEARAAPAPETKAAGSIDSQALEKSIAEVLGLRVRVLSRGTTGEMGEMRISYRSLEQLDEVVRRLKG